MDIGGEVVTSVPSRWPVRKSIPSGCLIERSCVLTDQALLRLQLQHQKKKKGNRGNRHDYKALISLLMPEPVH